jgi:type II secretory pathway pseudopilin PulG
MSRVIARLRAVDLRGEAGMTLPELLLSMIIGTVVLFAAFGLLDATIGVSAKVDRRVDAIQRGRVAMDTIVRDLRSQVCLPSTDPAVAPVGSLRAGSDNSVDFYADLGDGSASRPTQRRTITFSPTANTITETVYGATTTTRTLLTDVYPQDASTPVFSYFGWNGTTAAREATAPLTATTGLAATDLDKVARITVAFRVRRAGGGTASTAVSMQDDVYRRGFDPNLTDPTPGCW